MRNFDTIWFVCAKKKIRFKRYLKRDGKLKTFNLLDNRQLSSTFKKRMCDYTINNNFSLAILKKTVKNFMKNNV